MSASKPDHSLARLPSASSTKVVEPASVPVAGTSTRRVMYRGTPRTTTEIAHMAGLSEQAVRCRVLRGKRDAELGTPALSPSAIGRAGKAASPWRYQKIGRAK